MDSLNLTLIPQKSYIEPVIITLYANDDGVNPWNPSMEKISVYSDQEYAFKIDGDFQYITMVSVNDETYYIDRSKQYESGEFFLNKKNPFIECFGSVILKFTLREQTFISNAIPIMVKDETMNRNIVNMVDYIYQNCEKYLYEEHKHSTVSVGIKDDKDNKSFEAIMKLFEEIYDVYKEAYEFFKSKPNSMYSKQIQSKKVDGFEKMKTLSADTIRYIASHPGELVETSYDTGIQFNKKFYYPEKTLVECTIPSYNVFENIAMVTFLRQIIDEIGDYESKIDRKIRNSGRSIDGYIDSTHIVYKRSFGKMREYRNELDELKPNFIQLLHRYVSLFKFNSQQIRGKLNNAPVFTLAFKSIAPYRKIYKVINDWFHQGNYNLEYEDWLLSFMPTSKIYECYCLVKALSLFGNSEKTKFIESKKIRYREDRYYTNTNFNNTFIFKGNGVTITLYFQPKIHDKLDETEKSEIGLFRSVARTYKYYRDQEGIQDADRGSYYTPDYVLKCEYDLTTEYIIMDAKFSRADAVERNQAMELIFKYLFSISPSNDSHKISGLFVLFGKPNTNAKINIHDNAEKLNINVSPFFEMLPLGGENTDDNHSMETVIDRILQHIPSQEEAQTYEESEEEFEKPLDTEADSFVNDEIFYLRDKRGTYEAMGKLLSKSSKEFMLLKGSLISRSIKNSCPYHTKDDRKKYSEKLSSNYILLDDIKFSKPSRAAEFVVARTSNGNQEWKTKNDEPLIEFL